MADPIPYKRGYSFTNYQADVPDKPLPGIRVDKELDDIAQASRDLTARVNAGIDVSINNDALEAVAEEIDRVVFVANNMDDVRAVADLGPNIELANDLFLGAHPADPDAGNDGGALTIGATYYNTVIGESRVWNGTDWVPVAKVSTGGVLQGSIDVADGNTTFYVGDFVAIQVARNGLVLEPGVDYTTASPLITVPGAADGDTITFFAILKGSITDASSFTRQTVLTSAGVTSYALNTAGAPLNLTQTNHVLMGGSPFGMLTYGVDYTVSDGDLVLSFAPEANELYHIFSLPRFTNSEAQVVLQEYRDYVADLADRAEAAADRSEAAASSVEALAWSGTRDQFIEANNSGAFVAVPDGATLLVRGETYVKATGSTTIPAVPNWLLRPKQHKSILTGDWQPRLAYPAEIAALRFVLDDMQRWHGDADDMCHVGDVVDRATEGGTGNPEAVYGHDKILIDLWTRTAIQRVYMISGNHDSDGLGLGQHQYAGSQRRFMDYIGRRNYTVRIGNVLRVFMGTMTGEAGGNIHTTTLYWFDQMLRRNQGCNIEVYLHQPLYGYDGFVEDSQYVQYKSVCDRIVASLNAVDNVAFVCSGHVARPEALPNYYDGYGTRMFSVNMHIPRVTNGGDDGQGTGPELPYGVLEYRRGATTATVRMWNAATHGWLAGRDVPVTYKYPLDLGSGAPDFDGRYAAEASFPSFDGVVQIQRALWEDRKNNGTPEAPAWTSVQGLRPGLRMVLMETCAEDAKAGDGMSIDWWVPASITVPDASGTHNDISGNYLAGRVAVRRENGNDGNPTGQFAVQLGTAGTVGSLRDVLTADGSTGSVFAPLSALGDALPALGLLAGIGLDNSLLDKGRIVSGANLNNYTEPGIYRVQSGGDATAITNIPFATSGGVLLVLNPGATPGARPVAASLQIQVYIALAIADGGRIYYRVCNNGDWVGWRLVSSTAA